jgi:hypothetical protein
MATYGWDIHGMPVRNLIRHKREYPSPYDQTYSPNVGRPPGTDQYNQATDDDYELRRARTPVPTFVHEAVDTHLSKIYAKEVSRTAPLPLMVWWNNVDGRGTTIDQWMTDTLAPLLLVCGCLDVVVEFPPAPPDVEINSLADQIRYGLHHPVIDYILPENVVYWSLDKEGKYLEVLIREVQDDQNVTWRYWNQAYWVIYDKAGKQISNQTFHGLTEIPIVRLFDRRKPRCKNVGLPRYEAIAEIQREFYNRDSELILSDTTQAHALLQGPDDFVTPDGSLPVGPNWLLPMKGNAAPGGGKSYTGFSYVEPPKAGAESLRLNKYDLRDAVDRHAKMTKPAGVTGTTANAVAQSGISKQLDADDGNTLLTKLASMFARNETTIARLAGWVLSGGRPIDETVTPITVVYPTEFDLTSASDMASLLRRIQDLIGQGGSAPVTETTALSRIVRQGFRGLSDDTYNAMDQEIAGIFGQGRQPEIQLAGVPDVAGPAAAGPNTRAINQATLMDPLSRNPDELVG